MESWADRGRRSRRTTECASAARRPPSSFAMCRVICGDRAGQCDGATSSQHDGQAPPGVGAHRGAWSGGAGRRTRGWVGSRCVGFLGAVMLALALRPPGASAKIYTNEALQAYDNWVYLDKFAYDTTGKGKVTWELQVPVTANIRAPRRRQATMRQARKLPRRARSVHQLAYAAFIARGCEPCRLPVQ